MRIRLRWFNLGALAATFFYLWLVSEEEKAKETKEKTKETSWAGDNPSKMDEMYNKYSDPKWLYEKMYSEDHA